MSGTPSIWQLLQEYLLPGQQISSRPTGEKRFLLAYAGFRNIAQPLPWTESYDIGAPPVSAIAYGIDPVPGIQLYGSAQVQFVSLGGRTPPSAVAVFKKDTGAMEYPSPPEQEAVLRRLLLQ